jgi:hypothetical protein
MQGIAQTAFGSFGYGVTYFRMRSDYNQKAGQDRLPLNENACCNHNNCMNLIVPSFQGLVAFDLFDLVSQQFEDGNDIAYRFEPDAGAKELLGGTDVPVSA